MNKYHVRNFLIHIIFNFFLNFEEEINELDMLISELLKSDLNVYKYIHIENKILKGGLNR